jgi:hypothetical protein
MKDIKKLSKRFSLTQKMKWEILIYIKTFFEDDFWESCISLSSQSYFVQKILSAIY